MNNKVSVILPSLNVVDYIDEALNSVCSQTLKDIDILCIDAGSTDGTIDVIEKYLKKDHRVRLIISEKQSYGYQVNLGIKEAKGKYIAVLETDDFVHPGMYEKLYEIAEKYDADYVKADYDTFFSQDDGGYYYSKRHTFSDLSMYDSVINPRDNTLIGRSDWYLWQGIYLLKFLKENNILLSETPGAAFQDIGFLFWTGAYAEKAVYMRDVFYHYRIDRENSSSNVGKGLKFAYAEYYAIRKKLSNIDVLDENIRSLLYARMIKSFVSGYSRIVEYQDSIDDRKPIYEWFKSEISYAFEKGYVNDSLVLNGHLSRLKLLLKSEEMYFEQYSTKGFFQFINKKELFAIFGCGDFGFKAYNILKHNEKVIICFLDNNPDLWGKTLNGLQIKQPDFVTSLADNIFIVLANEVYYSEMRNQLLKLGIDERRIVVFQ